jgi:hypothetical protein
MDADERAIDEANRMYWEDEAPVAEIAERLDLSRRALYDALRPRSASVACSQCGADLQFGNRSARRAGVAACPSCGAEQAIEDPPSDESVAAPNLSVLAGQAPLTIRHDMRAPDLRHRAIVIGGAAIAGVALGTVAALLATRRD